MNEFMELLRFTNGFNIWGVLIRMVLAMFCGGLVGLEREVARRPAGFRTHILICLGSSLTTLTSQYIYLQMGAYTDLARLGAQVIAGMGFIGAGTIIVTKRRQVKGLTTAAGLWASAIVGLAIGAGFIEAALIATAMILIAEILLARFEHILIDSARDMHLYVEYDEESDVLDVLSTYFREQKVAVSDLQITKSTRNAEGERNPCAIFTVQLPRKFSHEKLLADIARTEGVVSVEEL